MGALPTVNNSKVTFNLMKARAPHVISYYMLRAISARNSSPIVFHTRLRVDSHVNNAAQPNIQFR
jgi:hypothetical protein